MENNFDTKKQVLAIPRKLLLSVYVIVPVLLTITLIDIFYFESSLLPKMGVDSLLLPLFVIIFNFPHIIASFFGFFDRDYLEYYNKQLFIYLPLLLMATAFLLYFNYLWGLVFFLVNDVWHGVKQKAGISLILGAKPGKLYKFWTLVPFVTASTAFIYVIRPSAFPDYIVPFISPVLFIGAILIIVSMVLMIIKSAPKVRWYIFSVSMLFLVSYFFILAGYIFFAILVFRFVHDVSAFAFYITHDHNRNLETKKNWLYRLTTVVPIPVIVITPILAYLFAHLTRTVTDGLAIGYSIVILISMCHYYLESVMWKRGSPHREQIHVR